MLMNRVTMDVLMVRNAGGHHGALSASAEAGSGVLLYNSELQTATAKMAPMEGPAAVRGEAGETMQAGEAPTAGLMHQAEEGGK